MKGALARAFLLWLLLAASGCAMRVSQINPGGPLPERAALLVSPDAAARSELARAASQGLHGAPVRLADDALTTESELIIERAQHRDAAGLPINGRSTEKPEHFRLVEQAGRCILIQERTGRRWTLRSATCAPIPAR